MKNVASILVICRGRTARRTGGGASPTRADGVVLTKPFDEGKRMEPDALETDTIFPRRFDDEPDAEVRGEPQCKDAEESDDELWCEC